MATTHKFQAPRCGFLGLVAGVLAIAAVMQHAKAVKIQTKGRIVMIGARAAGTALVNRLQGWARARLPFW